MSDKGGIKGTWDKQSSGAKAAIIIVGLCCIGVLLIIAMAGMFSPDKTGNDYTSSNVSTTTEPEPTPAPEESESQYKASCKTMSFKELDKNPDGHAGERVKFTGRVVQIMESTGSTDIRMDVNDNFGDTVYVVYDGTTTAVEDSMITIYGEVVGSYTYESQAGWQITVPMIRAKYIEVGSSNS